MTSEKDLAGRTIYIRDTEIMVFAAYAKDGVFEDQISNIARITNKGEIPFILAMEEMVIGTIAIVGDAKPMPFMPMET